ncbi:MAG: alpha/beta hydrolase [Muricauda sp.]|nr:MULTISPECIES: alpha/beta hydrolase [unclassified Allomuricauda]MAU16929.1 alpha/beta hydrolase [Allomuricauda sp.]|tara:strand:- start:1919 stop:2872 length:954 start_codon:yes stop_codon:yes gene_type:complete
MPVLKTITKQFWQVVPAIIAILFTQSGMGQEITSNKVKLHKQGMEVHYLHAGNGKTKWVMIHGLGSYSKAYTKILSNLPEHVEAYALDLPGYGKTPMGKEPISMENYATIVNGFVEELGLDKVVLMGHSMGGQIAITLALKKPKWLKNLILFSPAGIERFSKEDRKWFDTVATESLYLNLTDEQIRQNFNINFYGNQLPQDAEFMYQDRLKIKGDPEAYKQYCSTIAASINAMLSSPVYDHLGAIEVPTLVLFGKNDLLIPNKILHPDLTIEQLMEKLHKDYPNISNKIIDKAGHFIIWDQAQHVIELTNEFKEAHK